MRILALPSVQFGSVYPRFKLINHQTMDSIMEEGQEILKFCGRHSRMAPYVCLAPPTEFACCTLSAARRRAPMAADPTGPPALPAVASLQNSRPTRPSERSRLFACRSVFAELALSQSLPSLHSRPGVVVRVHWRGCDENRELRTLSIISQSDSLSS